MTYGTGGGGAKVPGQLLLASMVVDYARFARIDGASSSDDEAPAGAGQRTAGAREAAARRADDGAVRGKAAVTKRAEEGVKRAEARAEDARKADDGRADAARKRLSALALGDANDVDAAIDEARRAGKEDDRRNEDAMPAWLRSACDAAAVDAKRTRGRIEAEERARARAVAPPSQPDAEGRARAQDVAPPAQPDAEGRVRAQDVAPPSEPDADARAPPTGGSRVPAGVRLVRTSDGAPDPLTVLLRGS